MSAIGAGAGAGAEDTNDAGAALEGPPDIGQTVFVASFGAVGIVRGVSGKHVEVEIRGKRMRVPAASLRHAPTGAPPQTPAPSRPRGSSPNVQTPSARSDGFDHTPVTELVLIGSTVDQALDRAEKFLDNAILADERRLRVVHGHGTGRLREALTKFFREHPLVQAVSAAGEREGGAGATIVELKD